MSPSSLAESNKDLVELLDCPICMEFMYPPIYQCPNGHILCSNCKTKVSNCCPSCRSFVGDIRSLVIEKVAGSLEFRCKHRNLGCAGSFRYGEKWLHEEYLCARRPYKCPFPCSSRCGVTGDVKSLVTHLKDDHHSQVTNGDQILPAFHFGIKLPILTVYHCFGQHFCLHVYPLDEAASETYPTCLAYVTFMGEKTEARSYRYRLALHESFSNRVTMSFEGEPISIREVNGPIPEDVFGLYFPGYLVVQYFPIATSHSLRGKFWKA